MKLFTCLSCLCLLLVILAGCGGKETNLSLNKNRLIAVLTLDGNLPELKDKEEVELKRVIKWMDRDLVDRLREEEFTTSYIKEMKDYSSEMGDLFIVNVEFFNAGRRTISPGPSSLELRFKLLDEKGALVAEWQDGADSRRGGTYCARLLNQRAVEKLDSLYPD